MHDRTFVGGDGVHVELEGGAQVAEGGLAGVVIDGGVLEEHIRLAEVEQLEGICGGGVAGEEFKAGARGSQAQGVINIHAVGVSDQAVVGGADGGDGEGEVEIGGKLGCFALQEAEEGLADVAKTEQGEVIVRS